MEPENTLTPEIDDLTPAEAHMCLIINRDVLNVLKKYGLDINHLFILMSMAEDAFDLIDIYDDNLNNKRVLVEDYQFLYMHGFITQSGEEETYLYDLDKDGKAFVDEVKKVAVLPGELKETHIELSKLASEYLEVWPAKTKLPSGVYARVSIVEIEKKLRSFLKTFKGPLKKEYGISLTAKDIIEATKLYVDRFQKKGFMYMVNSSYFIQKKEKSALADEIIAMKQGIIAPTNKWEKQV